MSLVDVVFVVIEILLIGAAIFYTGVIHGINLCIEEENKVLKEVEEQYGTHN